MKGKRYATQQKIRNLREAEQSDATVVGVCRDRHSVRSMTWSRALASNFGSVALRASTTKSAAIRLPADLPGSARTA